MHCNETLLRTLENDFKTKNIKTTLSIPVNWLCESRVMHGTRILEGIFKASFTNSKVPWKCEG